MKLVDLVASRVGIFLGDLRERSRAGAIVLRGRPTTKSSKSTTGVGVRSGIAGTETACRVAAVAKQAGTTAKACRRLVLLTEQTAACIRAGTEASCVRVSTSEATEP